MSISTTIRIPTSTTTLTVINTSSKLRGKVRPANGSMTPATGVESPIKIRELPRSTTREQAAKLRSPGRPIAARPTRVQAPEPERRIVADRRVPRPWIVGDSRVPSVVRTEEALPRWIAVVERQAVKACPPNPHREAVEVEEPAVAEVPVVVAAAVVAVAAAVEDDRRGEYEITHTEK
jgi:hypothetical protein